MFARMQDVKLGKEFDEQGESISNVDQALARYGINLRDTSGDFRDLGDVLDEIGQKWQTLGRMEQSEIAKAIAGKLYARTHSNMWMGL